MLMGNITEAKLPPCIGFPTSPEEINTNFMAENPNSPPHHSGDQAGFHCNCLTLWLKS